MLVGETYGLDSANRFGRRHRNKYAVEIPPAARGWCNAVNGNNQYCALAANHPGDHQFGPGARR